jgi:ribosomal protein S18 acetylase RimI-like enzyme
MTEPRLAGPRVLIRPMADADAPAAAAIIRDHDAFDGDCSQGYYRRYFADPARLASPREANFVAQDRDTGAVSGVCGFGPDKYDTPEILWLTWFYVRSDYRRQGVGRALLEYTLAAAEALGTRKVYLDTSTDPSYQAALRVYAHYGFRLEGDLSDYYEKGESLIIMGRDCASRQPGRRVSSKGAP